MKSFPILCCMFLINSLFFSTIISAQNMDVQNNADCDVDVEFHTTPDPNDCSQCALNHTESIMSFTNYSYNIPSGEFLCKMVATPTSPNTGPITPCTLEQSPCLNITSCGDENGCSDGDWYFNVIWSAGAAEIKN